MSCAVAAMALGQAPPLTITSSTLSPATLGAPYSDTLAAAGGVPLTTWSISSGSLPAGLSLDPATGVISGTPSAPGLAFGVVVTDPEGQSATASLSISVAAGPPTTSLLKPDNGATLQGTVWLNAGATVSLGIATVDFVLSGDTVDGRVIGSAPPGPFGYISGFDSTSVPNGTYTLESRVTDADGRSARSMPITVNVNNPTVATTVLAPADGSPLQSSEWLDASVSNIPNVATVEFTLTGDTLSQSVIAAAAPTMVGWLAAFDSTTVPDGTYTLQSVATDSGGATTTSSPVSVTIKN